MENGKNCPASYVDLEGNLLSGASLSGKTSPTCVGFFPILKGLLTQKPKLVSSLLVDFEHLRYTFVPSVQLVEIHGPYEPIHIKRRGNQQL